MKPRRMPLTEVPDATLESLGGGGLFASRGFLELWRGTGGCPMAWTIEADGAVAALLPAVEFGSGPLVRLASLPDGLSSGLLVHPAMEHARSAFGAALLEGIARRRYRRVDVFDLRATLPAVSGYSVQGAHTRLVEIGPDWVPADAKLRSQIRKAAREGVVVEAFDWARHHRRFLGLAECTYQRHGVSPRYPAGLYRRMAALATRDPRIRWLWCEREGTAVSSHIYFVDHDVVHAWQSYFDKRFSCLKSNPYIRYAVCRDVAREGVAWLSLGATPAGARGLAYYKARWGGTGVRFATYVRREPVGRLSDACAAWLRDRRTRFNAGERPPEGALALTSAPLRHGLSS